MAVRSADSQLGSRAAVVSRRSPAASGAAREHRRWPALTGCRYRRWRQRSASIPTRCAIACGASRPISLRGLGHASAGKPKNVAFTDAVRDEIARVAMHSPSRAGEALHAMVAAPSARITCWVAGSSRRSAWKGCGSCCAGCPCRRPTGGARRALSGSLGPELRRAMESLAQDPRHDRSLRAQIVLASSRGLNEAEIAAALHLGRATVRRWLRRFRRNGILGLQTHAAPRPSSHPRRGRQYCAWPAVTRIATGSTDRNGRCTRCRQRSSASASCAPSAPDTCGGYWLKPASRHVRRPRRIPNARPPSDKTPSEQASPRPTDSGPPAP